MLYGLPNTQRLFHIVAYPFSRRARLCVNVRDTGPDVRLEEADALCAGGIRDRGSPGPCCTGVGKG